MHRILFLRTHKNECLNKDVNLWTLTPEPIFLNIFSLTHTQPLVKRSIYSHCLYLFLQNALTQCFSKYKLCRWLQHHLGWLSIKNGHFWTLLSIMIEHSAALFYCIYQVSVNCPKVWEPLIWEPLIFNLISAS
jgi:hypothetical protein